MSKYATFFKDKLDIDHSACQSTELAYTDAPERKKKPHQTVWFSLDSPVGLDNIKELPPSRSAASDSPPDCRI